MTQTYFADIEFTREDISDTFTLTSFLKKKLGSTIIRVPLTNAKQGLIYWLGTNGFMEEWQNPYKMITVHTASGYYPIKGDGSNSGAQCDETELGRPALCILYEQNSRDSLVTYGSSKHDFILDFGPNLEISMTAYTLYSSYNTVIYFKWIRVSISNDNVHWKTISEHEKEKPSTWTCSQTNYFRYLKIEKYREQYLLLSGIELYGFAKLAGKILPQVHSETAMVVHEENRRCIIC
jgi:hypothetical protein